MSTAITVVGNTQVLYLNPAKLILGIRIQGVIGHLDINQPNLIKPRPYLHYLAKTIQKINCDVTLFYPLTQSAQARENVEFFCKRDFPVPFRVIYDHAASYGGTKVRGNGREKLAPRNYSDFLSEVAAQKGSNASRVLFLDSEINYRYNTAQTLILEEYHPLTRRQQRKRFQKEMEEEMSIDRGRRSGALSEVHASRRRESEAGSRQSGEYEEFSQLLQKEAAQSAAHTAQEGLYEATGRGGWLGRHGGPTMPVHRPTTASSSSSPAASEAEVIGMDSPVLKRRGLERTLAQEREKMERFQERSTTSPFAKEGIDLNITSGGGEEKKTEGEEEEEAPFSTTPGTPRALAINLEDYSLIAVAEMIAELAASLSSTAEYLKYEPMVEKLNVPSHGIANYLPIENCDYIETVDWDKVEIREAKEEERRRNTVEDVEESEEHRDFFR